MTAREFREQCGIGPDRGKDGVGGRARGGPRGRIAARRRDQDMGGLIEVAGAEARAVLLVEPPTCGLIRLGRDDFALDKSAHRRLFRGLEASFGIAQRLGFDAEALGFLQQQFAHHQRPRRGLPGQDRLFRRMVLHLAGDDLARDHRAVDADRLRLGQRIGDRAIHDLLRGLKRTGGASVAAAHDLIAAAAEIPDRRAPDVDEPGKREQQEDRHAQQQMRLEDRIARPGRRLRRRAAASGCPAPTP